MTSSPSTRIKVLYIAGAGRSGSTVLCNLLGQIDGFFSCGELYKIYCTPPDQRYCGCGRLLSQCEVWDPILRRALGDDYGPQTARALQLRNEIARSRYALLWAAPFLRTWVVQRAREYLSLTGRLYRHIAEVTQARVIVDSSKVSSYGQLLAQIPGIDFQIIHLVRDARAVAYSWQRKRFKPSPENRAYLPTASPLHGSLKWIGHNIATELLIGSTRVPCLRIQYEQFAASPRPVVERIVQFVGESASLPSLEGNLVQMQVHHTVGGNPDRFRTGPVELKPDDGWQTKMKPIDRVVTTLLTWPLLLRYGYRL
jgi:hypothetical protein